MGNMGGCFGNKCSIVFQIIIELNQNFSFFFFSKLFNLTINIFFGKDKNIIFFYITKSKNNPFQRSGNDTNDNKTNCN